MTCRHGASVAAVRGFTYVELLMSLSVLAILATVAMPIAQLAHQRRQEQLLAQSLRDIRQGIDAYRKAVDQGRIRTSPTDSGFPKTLGALVNGVVDEKSPARRKIYFLRSIPRDPFNRDASLPADRTWDTRSSDSAPDTFRNGDDIFDVRSRAEGIGMNGVPYRQW